MFKMYFVPYRKISTQHIKQQLFNWFPYFLHLLGFTLKVGDWVLKKRKKTNKQNISLFVVRDFAKAATFEGHEIREPSVIFPVLQKTTVNVLMSVPRLLLKRKLPGNHRAVCFIRLLAVNENIKLTVLLVTSLQQRLEWGIRSIIFIYLFF